MCSWADGRLENPLRGLAFLQPARGVPIYISWTACRGRKCALSLLPGVGHCGWCSASVLRCEEETL